MQTSAGSIADPASSAIAGMPGQSGSVHAAIANAANATGVDFGYLLAQARLESGLDPRARARTSSAAGLYQFTGQTWLGTLARHGADHGLDWAGDAVGNAATNPGLRNRLLALRHDPQLSALLAGDLANDNRAALMQTLGREPDNAELYLAHFLGAEGAGRFLSGLASNPDASAAALLPKAAAANRAIFYAPGGTPRSLAGVMDLLRSRLDAAGSGSTLPPLSGSWSLASLPYGDPAALDGPWADLPSGAPDLGAGRQSYTGGPVAQEFQQAAGAAGPAGGAASPRASMADTLRDTFALAAPGTPAGDHVARAYGRLKAMGL
ncbi:lytic transglycosylase domain-containing protein [Novosphingobium pokkalii]|uniref:Lytic transglycosylase domain-containing protein n=1 Tax=Novosphingobium pokkalii TaxID=1770194 RepID=A0ABV7V3G4_9SPHN|nr:lytic transglycosylase domain-containing protein [Novosphingobium pokkalii]